MSAAGAGAEVDFKDWHFGTMTVFLCLSAPKFPVFNCWLRLVLTSALDKMTDTLNPPAQPVCFMLDELATLGHVTSVETAVGLAAGYGIQLVTIFQDVAQMRDLYKGRWASFIGNAGVRALFNLDDYDSADYWSKPVGYFHDNGNGRLFDGGIDFPFAHCSFLSSDRMNTQCEFGAVQIVARSRLILRLVLVAGPVEI